MLRVAPRTASAQCARQADSTYIWARSHSLVRANWIDATVCSVRLRPFRLQHAASSAPRSVSTFSPEAASLCSDDITKLANQMNEARREELEELTNEILGPGCTFSATNPTWFVVLSVVAASCSIRAAIRSWDEQADDQRKGGERNGDERANAQRTGRRRLCAAAKVDALRAGFFPAEVILRCTAARSSP